MKIIRSAALLASLALAATPLAAHEYKLGNLTIEHPYVPATAAMAKTAAGYLTIINSGGEPDRLIAVRSPLPRTSIHTTEVDAEGVARMSEMAGVEIPPGATVELAPQGQHLMFMGLDAGLAPGATIDATLIFERAGEIAVQFEIEERGGSVGHGDQDATGG